MFQATTYSQRLTLKGQADLVQDRQITSYKPDESNKVYSVDFTSQTGLENFDKL